MAGNYLIYKHGIENKFSTYTATHTTEGSVTTAKVTITLGGAPVDDSDINGDIYTAYRILWERLHDGQTNVIPALTQTQIDNLTSIDEGVVVDNIDTGILNVCRNGSFSNQPPGLWTRPPKYEATTDGTQTTIDSFTLVDDSVCIVRIHVTAVEYDGSDRAAYIYTAAVYRNGGNVAFQGTIRNALVVESDTSWGVAITLSGNDVRASVTGVASQTIYWTCSMQIMES